LKVGAQIPAQSAVKIFFHQSGHKDGPLFVRKEMAKESILAIYHLLRYWQGITPQRER